MKMHYSNGFILMAVFTLSMAIMNGVETPGSLSVFITLLCGIAALGMGLWTKPDSMKIVSLEAENEQLRSEIEKLSDSSAAKSDEQKRILAEVLVSQNTTGEYFIRIEDAGGIKEVILTPTEFAKAVTGKLAKATVIS